MLNYNEWHKQTHRECFFLLGFSHLTVSQMFKLFWTYSSIFLNHFLLYGTTPHYCIVETDLKDCNIIISLFVAYNLYKNKCKAFYLNSSTFFIISFLSQTSQVWNSPHVRTSKVLEDETPDANILLGFSIKWEKNKNVHKHIFF